MHPDYAAAIRVQIRGNSRARVRGRARIRTRTARTRPMSHATGGETVTHCLFNKEPHASVAYQDPHT